MSGRRERLVISPTEKYALSRLEAAAFVGQTPTAFDEMVADGLMPRARLFRTVDRWLRPELERAANDMPEKEGKKKLSPYSDVA